MNAKKVKQNKSINILVICRQRLKNIQGATRAFNMYRHLEKLGCKVFYIDGWVPSIKPQLKNLMPFLKIVFFKLIVRKPKYIFVENVQNYIFMKLLKKLNIPVVVDVRDDLNLHAESMRVELEPEIRVKRELDTIITFKIARYILLPSLSFKKFYSTKFGKRFDKKFIVVMNASDHEHFKPAPLPDEPRIGFIGGANWGEGWELLIEAARIAKKEIPDLTLHIAYNYLPATKDFVEQIRKRYNDPWIYYYENEVFYYKNAPEFYNSLYLVIIPREKTKINEFATPSKLFDAMASGRPIIVTDCNEMKKVVIKEKCGLVSRHSPEELAKSIVFLIKNKELAKTMGYNGRLAVEVKHNWSKRAKLILERLNEPNET